MSGMKCRYGSQEAQLSCSDLIMFQRIVYHRRPVVLLETHKIGDPRRGDSCIQCDERRAYFRQHPTADCSIGDKRLYLILTQLGRDCPVDKHSRHVCYEYDLSITK